MSASGRKAVKLVWHKSPNSQHGAAARNNLHSVAHGDDTLFGGNNSLTIAPDGFDTVITTSASTSDSVTLVNYDNSANTLTADDFLFT